MSDQAGNVNFSYVANGIIPTENKGALQEEFIGELTYMIDNVLQQAQSKIIGLAPEDAWDLVIKCANRMRENKADADTRDLNQDGFTRIDFEVFLQKADQIVPSVISEIEKRYGQEELSKAVAPDDILSSIKEKMVDCTWLYLKAKRAGNQKMMFECAKQLYAAKNNQFVISTLLDEMDDSRKNDE